MTVTIQQPADISAALGARWDDVPRRSLEAIAIEGYRSGALIEGQVRRVLELDTRFHVHALLKAHHVPLRYTPADLADDLDAHRASGILPDR
jgi:predicted HTH domain antitoxin